MEAVTVVPRIIARHPMPLSSGVRLGVYEVTELIGAGGMGEVYRARDSTLNRDVALKILPEVFALDPDRLARFRREAQVLAALNHPNIASIYGFEGSGGVQVLVLEFVDGPTVADRIARGPIPLDEALSMAAQIAVALEASRRGSTAPRRSRGTESGCSISPCPLDGRARTFSCCR